MTLAGNDAGTGADPLDARLGRGLRPVSRRRRWGSRVHLALGLSPTPRPGLVLILLGMALGPHGLGVLSAPVLTTLDPAVSVALAALGAFVGLELDLRRTRGGLLLLAGSVEAGLTLVIVAAGVLAVHAVTGAAAPWLLALLLGVCAAPSSTIAATPADRTPAPARRIGDLDDVLPIVVGMLVLAAVRDSSPAAVAWLSVRAALAALAIAAAGWLLMSRTSSITEERVFAIGALLLLGGAAAYLSLSALFAGLVAGSLWRGAGALARDRLRRDLGYLQHPFVALLLVVAGARVDFPGSLAGVTAVYLVCRIAGKLAGGWIASVAAPRDLRSDAGLSLLAPGVVGIAFALNVVQARGDAEMASMVLAIVIAGSIASDLVSLVVSQPDQRA